MGDRVARNQRRVVKNQRFSGGGRLYSSVYRGQHIWRASASRFPSGDHKIKNCVGIGSRVGYAGFCSGISGGNRPYGNSRGSPGRTNGSFGPGFSSRPGRPDFAGVTRRSSGPGRAGFTCRAGSAYSTICSGRARGASRASRTSRTSGANVSRRSSRTSRACWTGRPGGAGNAGAGCPGRACRAGSAYGTSRAGRARGASRAGCTG